MKPSGFVTTAAVVFVGLVLIKDGTAQTLVGNVATAVQTFVKGIKPITTVG